MASNQVTLTFAGDTKSLERAFGRVQDQAQKVKVGLGSAFKIGAVTALASKAMDGLTAALSAGWKEFEDGARVAAQTSAAIKSTGGVANVTAAQIDALGTSLMNKSGMDDEAIKSGANLLLTFTGIRNEVGKGNDIFNQATGAALDMSVAFGQDMKSSAIQLGKALGDPVKGVSALQRVGVSFTSAQQDQIKAMVAAGNTMGAQKIILGELNKEVGGSAAAYGKTLPGQIDIAKQTLLNFAGDAVAKVVPAFLAVTSWVRANWPTITAVINTVMGAARVAIAVAVDWVRANVVPVFQAIVAWVRANWPQISATAQQVFGALQRAVQSAIAWIQTNVVPVLRSVFDAAKTLIQTTISVITTIWNKWGADIVNVVRTNFNAIIGVLRPIFATIKGVIDTFTALLHGDWSGVWNGLKEIVSGALRTVVAVIRGMVNEVLAAAKLLGQMIWDGIKAGLASLAGLAGALAKGVVDGVREVLTTAYGIAKQIGQRIIDGAVDGLKSLGSTLKGVVESGLHFLGHLLPFSPVEHGGAIYIGEPIIKGAVEAIQAGMPTLRKAVETTVAAAVAGARTGPISDALLSKLGLPTNAERASTVDPLSAGHLAYAYAQLTPQLSDDFKALQQLVSEATTTLAAAAKSGSAQAWLDAAQNLKQAQDNLAALGPLQQLPDGTVVPLSQMQDTTLGNAPIGLNDPNLLGYQLPGQDYVSLQDVPAMAAGGIVTRPMIAKIGEAGPEAVIPLGSGGGAAPTVINITVNSSSLDPNAAATAVIHAIDSWEQRNGQRYARA